MQFPLACTVISAEPVEQSTYARTGEVTPARGEIYVLTSDRGKPVCKKVSCSHTLAMEMSKREVGLSVGDVVKETTLPLDISEYKLDSGKSGVSLKLVEPVDVPKEEFLDSVGLSKSKHQPNANSAASPAGQSGVTSVNGSTVGARPVSV